MYNTSMYNFVVLPIKSDMNDKRKTSTCHLDVLIFRVLWHACNECNVFSKVEKKKKLAFLLAFRSSSWT